MQRCLTLALRGSGRVAPNPMVGAVLVHDNRIIGEGWHQAYGAAHAEVNCIEQALSNGNEQYLRASTLYVNLEPCAHFGKTPPCTDLILRHHIPGVVIGLTDPFALVNGRGIEKLRENGVEVVTGILEQESRTLNRRFITCQLHRRPYVILKWAQTSEGIIGSRLERIQVSGPAANRLVHRWRSEEAAILVGKHTALTDDPALTTRLWPGPSPVRMVLDMKLELPGHLRIFDGQAPLVVFNGLRHSITDTISPQTAINYYRLDPSRNLIPQLMEAVFSLGIQSVLVEGGRTLLQSFIDENCWDEARIIGSSFSPEILREPVAAPVIPEGKRILSREMVTDRVEIFTPA